MGKGRRENNQTGKKIDTIVYIIGIIVMTTLIWLAYRTGGVKNTLIHPPIIWLNIL